MKGVTSKWGKYLADLALTRWEVLLFLFSYFPIMAFWVIKLPHSVAGFSFVVLTSKKHMRLTLLSHYRWGKQGPESSGTYRSLITDRLLSFLRGTCSQVIPKPRCPLWPYFLLFPWRSSHQVAFWLFGKMARLIQLWAALETILS